MNVYREFQRSCGAICVGFILLLTPAAAHAVLMFQIDRISDTVGIVTATGTLDGPAPGGNAHILSFQNPFGVAPVGFQNAAVLASSTMTIGGTPVDFGNELGPSFAGSGGDPWIYFGKTGLVALLAGSSVTGSFEIGLVGGRTFAAVGSTGDLTWGLAAAGGAAGSWEIVSSTTTIAAPASLALLGLGMLAIGLNRRRTAA